MPSVQISEHIRDIVTYIHLPLKLKLRCNVSPDSLCSRTLLMLPWELTSLWSSHSVLTPILNFSKHISSHLKGRWYFDFSEKKKTKLTSVNFQISLQQQICQSTAVWFLSSLSFLPPSLWILTPASQFTIPSSFLILFTSPHSFKQIKLFCFCFLKMFPLCNSGWL